MTLPNIFIDCEFNGYKGELISMALVCDGSELYFNIGCNNPVQWVKDNVMPVIGEDQVSISHARVLLENYLNGIGEFNLIADWPEDISYFCNFLIVAPGVRIDTPNFTAKIFRNLNSDNSKIRHNALEDARAIRAMYDAA
jgi:hypothetical protein